MDYRMCHQVVRVIWSFPGGRELDLFFPDAQTFHRFQEYLVEISAEDSKESPVHKLEGFLSDTGVEVGGHATIPLASSLLLLKAVRENT